MKRKAAAEIVGRPVVQELEQLLRNLRASLAVADLGDAEYRKWESDNGYVTEGQRWSRREIEQWIERIEKVLGECQKRIEAGDVACLDAMRWYGDARWLEAHMRFERYADRFGPLIRQRVNQRMALDARKVPEDERVKHRERYRELGPSISSAERYRQIAEEFSRGATTIRESVLGVTHKKKK